MMAQGNPGGGIPLLGQDSVESHRKEGGPRPDAANNRTPDKWSMMKRMLL